MSSFVLHFHEIGISADSIAGGKAAKLAALSRLEGIRVPEAFCISTEAFKEIISRNTITGLIDQLSFPTPDNPNRLPELCKQIRHLIESTAVPENIREQIKSFIKEFGKDNAYAIRSSATAEDLPTASFAGQQDTFLNISGEESILDHVRKCWASLFTDRAVIYRMQNGFSHQQVYLSVIVQKMVFARASGILFTADPVTSNRKVLTVNAGFGLGEALVSGLVNPDCYKVQEEKIIEKLIAEKRKAIYPCKDGGIEIINIDPAHQHKQTLSDSEILELARIGRRIEKWFGYPQDIEWCLSDDTFYILQSRPITTLYPVPEADDEQNHVYISVGHNQMMTDAMKPLGLSFFLLTTSAPMRTAGGRLFVDVTKHLGSSSGRKLLMNTIGKSDPLILDALRTIIQRGDVVALETEEDPQTSALGKAVLHGNHPPIGNDPSIVSHLIQTIQNSIRRLKQDIQTKSGMALFDFIRQHIEQSRNSLTGPQGLAVIMAAMDASFWINEKMELWLGEKGAADILSQSVPNNITSEMGLALLDVADTIRPYPEIIHYLQRTRDENFLEEVERFDGGSQVRTAVLDFLDKYGMRCAGEIDITKTRWSEKPSILIPIILNNIKNFEPGAAKQKFEQGLQEATKKEEDLLMRVKDLPDGEQKVLETKQKIHLLRNFTGYREYPKYGMVTRFFIYKKALLKEADKLVKEGVLQEKEDIYYLTFEELRQVTDIKRLDYGIIHKRKEEFIRYEKLIPPRVITSDGEVFSGKYNRENLPAGAIVGLPVSSGIIEGRARVVVKMEDADLEDGDILVTAFTDPSWTPLFVSIKGLVTEVGGLMTHGAVIAREYGLPAIVGVEHATTLIKDGQKIRLNGTEGYVEIL